MKDYTRLLCLGVLVLALAPSALACLNPIGRSTVSEPIYVEELAPPDFLKALTTHEGKTYWLGVLAELKIEKVKTSYGRTENLTNTAVAMLHLGMVKQAIRILEDLERTDPGSYYTAANLGTGYELNGENAKALKWIKEGINRNPDAHNGSEWLHVRILEAKLALEKDPNFLASNSVIGIDRVANDELPPNSLTISDHLGQSRDLKQIHDALVYQLHERLEFIKPPEAVVANLLFDLTRVLSITRGQDHAEAVVALAATYGPDLRPWSVRHLPLPAISLPPVPTWPYWVGGASAIVVVFLAATLLWLRRRRKLLRGKLPSF